MTETPNHGYNVPEQGEENWHVPLNENFERYDTDIELRDEEANLDDYEPKAGAKYLATDTGVVYIGDGSDWLATFQAGRYSAPSDSSNAGGVAFGDPANEANSDGATVGGGVDNNASRSKATIGGGEGNRAADEGATVGGGIDNRASGEGSTVPGGRENLANGRDSFAAGRMAEARRTGSFVWNNSGDRFVDTDEGQFLVNATGGVGIGTQNPDAPFHIRGSEDPARAGDLLVGTSTDNLSLTVVTEGSGAGLSRLISRTDGDDRSTLRLGADDDFLEIGYGNDDDFPYLTPTENEGASIGNHDTDRFSSVWAWSVHTDNVFENSDARLKRNVSRLQDGLQTITELRPVTYEWKEERSQHDGIQLGLIAQEVEEVLPEVVQHQDSDGDGEDATLAVKYTKLVPVLIDAVQSQQEVIVEREKRIDDLEAGSERKDERIDKLEERLAALEDQAHTSTVAPADD